MPRKRKYNTKEEIIDARRKWANEYYAKNRKKVQEKRMERYYAETKHN
jgi:hypothetical protein